MNVQTPLGLTVSVYQGHQNEGFADLVPLASVEVERWYMAPGVRRVNVTEDGLSATLFLPSGRTRVCGVGGSFTVKADSHRKTRLQCISAWKACRTIAGLRENPGSFVCTERK